MVLKVYLDFNKWVDLGRAQDGHPKGAPYRDVLELAKAGVDLGLAAFPLSADHYMEVTARNRFESRQKMTKVMRRLSQDRVMAGLQQVMPCEIDRSLRELLGRPRDPRSCQVFGLSLFEALDQDAWKYNPPAGMTLTPQQERIVDELFKHFMLAGPPDGVNVPGLDRQAYRGPGRTWCEEQRRLAGLLEGKSKEYKRNVLLARGIVDLATPLLEALNRAGLTWAAFESLGQDGLTAFLRSCPTKWAEVEMLYQHHLNSALLWRDNDLIDVVTLSIGLVYCDVVVAEKFWVDMARRARLDQLYGTTLLTDLRDLEEVLVTAA